MIHRFDSLPSTMIEAAHLAAQGAPGGTTVVADEQTAGQGRLGRNWHSPPGTGLYFTTILRLPELVPTITLALGVAVAEAIRDAAGIVPDLRWPNDVMVKDRKLAGILAQFDHGAVLAGIGVNVNQANFPEEIAAIATSLRIETGREHDRDHLLSVILKRIEWADPASAIHDFSSRSSYVAGRRVSVDQGTETLFGTTMGLTSEGFLLLRKDDGTLETIYAGGVRPWS